MRGFVMQFEAAAALMPSVAPDILTCGAVPDVMDGMLLRIFRLEYFPAHGFVILRLGNLGLFHMFGASHRCGAVIGIRWSPKLLCLRTWAQPLEREVPCQTRPSHSCMAKDSGSCAASFLQSCLAVGRGKGLLYYERSRTYHSSCL